MSHTFEGSSLVKDVFKTRMKKSVDNFKGLID